MAAVGLIVTIIGASSAYFSARDATQERKLAQDVLERVNQTEARIDSIGNAIEGQSQSIESQARSFYESRLKQLTDIYNQSFGPCQAGPVITCFSYYREMLNVAEGIMGESSSEIFKKINDQNSIKFRVCQRVKGINESANSTLANNGEGKIMAEQLVESAKFILSEYCN